MTMNQKRTPCYIARFNYQDPLQRKLITALRKLLKDLSGPKVRIKLQGRLGVDNPNASKYREKKSCRCISLKDSGYVDAYLYSREYDPNFDPQAEVETLLFTAARYDED